MSEAAPIDDGRCFVCGPYNAEGMHLRFERAGEGAVRATIVLPPRFQGWRGTAHGGVVMMLLDEAMAYACGELGLRGMTAKMDLRFREPVPLGVQIVITGKVKWHRRHVIALESAISLAGGTVLATAEGSFVSKGPLAKERLGIPDRSIA
ncbi:MAG TPA: PaaI family thioesterase [Candidatus Elarobacter sp.]|nr:PaaI family thioesterase [Candidatus Elarobacter sp.]